MPIRVKCLNPGCGKAMLVKDEMAGKKGRCPGCGGVIPIPAAEAAAEANPFAFDAPGEAPAPPAAEEPPAPKSKPAPEPPPEEDEEEVEEKPKKKKKKPVDEEEERDDEEEEEDDDRPRKKKKRKKKKKKKYEYGTSASTTAIAVALGIGLLLCLGVTTVLEWITAPPRSTANFQVGYYPPRTLIEMWEGKAILGFSITISVLVAVAYGLSFVMEEESGDNLLDASGAIAEAWAVAVAVWLMGFVWWSISIRFRIEHAAVKELDLEISIFPYMGIFLGLLMSLGVGLLFSYFVAARGRKFWIVMGQLGGGLLGVALAMALQPWDAR
ncbi:MAG: hypothetical protein AB7K24_10690 [Gemmataceae bacterium]